MTFDSSVAESIVEIYTIDNELYVLASGKLMTF